MLSKRLFLNLLVPFVLLTSAPFAGAQQPADTISFGNETKALPLLRENLRVFVWNIHKATDANIYKDFLENSAGADLALFQESITNTQYIQEITNVVPYLGWTMAKCFQQSNLEYTGVATGSRVKALREEVIFSSAREPLINTPKTILLSEYAIEGSAQTLLVANIHAINFVGPGTYKTQIRQLVDKVKDHQGPLIIAGDFNTWDMDRRAILNVFFKPLNVQKLTMPPSFKDLDHIYVRGLEARTVYNLSHVKSSDHAPLMADLYFLGDL